MSYPAYARTRPSQFAWLPEIPAHWKIMRLKTVAKTKLSNVDKHSVEGQQSVRLCNYTDVYYNSRITSRLSFMEATASDEQIAKFQLRKGDVLITKDSETPDDIGVPALVAEELSGVICGYHLAHIRPSKALLGGYLYYALLCPPSHTYFCSSATGITRYGISTDDITTTPIIVPPLSEQQAIASFLDRKTTKIDHLIHLKEQQIGLL